MNGYPFHGGVIKVETVGDDRTYHSSLDKVLSSRLRSTSGTSSAPVKVCSSVGLLHVLDYTPAEGEQGAPITVNFTCKGDLALDIRVRLVIGRRAVSTQVRHLGYERWQLVSLAPPFVPGPVSTARVTLTVQAVDQHNALIDSVTFGHFIYWESDNTLGKAPDATSAVHDLQEAFPYYARNQDITSVPRIRVPSPRRYSPISRVSTPTSSSASERLSPARSQLVPSKVTPCPAKKVKALQRIRPSKEHDRNNPRMAVIQLIDPLDVFCYDWNELELEAGRRLIRFKSIQDGRFLMVYADCISQEEYSENDIVISCIYREDVDGCCVTSVDIIHLLEGLVDEEFEVEEKNRIRRNLEGLRPTTISKTRPGLENLFARIMKFGEPKPRKIEKDLKIFDWMLLPQALEKIISKYEYCTEGDLTDPPFENEDAAVGDDSSAQVPQTVPFLARETEQQDMDFPEPLSATATEEEGFVPVMSVEGEKNQPVFVDSDSMNGYSPAPRNDLYNLSSAATLSFYCAQGSPSFVMLTDSAYNSERKVDDHESTSGNGLTNRWTPDISQDLRLGVKSEDIERSLPTTGLDADHLFSLPGYGLNTFDSFELQTLRDQNLNSAIGSQPNV